MTKPRKKPSLRYHAFLVEPGPGFDPTNWQQTPQHYRIIEYAGPMKFLGSADAWKFLHNHEAMSSGQTDQWALFLDMDAPMVNPATMFASRVGLFDQTRRGSLRDVVRT